MFRKSLIEVWETDEYSRFELLDGNRDIKDSRVANIMGSIQEVGYLPIPLLVNENLQVIDGQGRLTALKKLGLPVYFIKGYKNNGQNLGIKECIAVNINQSNWNNKDYVKSYSDQGNKSYQYIWILMNKYETVPLEAIVAALSKTFISSGFSSTLKNGEYVFSEEDFKEAEKEIAYLEHFNVVYEKGSVNRRCFYAAIQYGFRHPDCDNDRLLKMITENYLDVPSCSKLADLLRYVDEIYNRNLPRKNYISLHSDYLKGMYC